MRSTLTARGQDVVPVALDPHRVGCLHKPQCHPLPNSLLDMSAPNQPPAGSDLAAIRF